MNENLLEQTFHSIARRMIEDFQLSGGFKHSTGKGTAREGVLHQFVERYLPGHIRAFHNAEVMSVDGQRSGQCDILICDRSTPPLLDMDNYRIVPNECVYGIIEVKSSLDCSQLIQDCEKIKKVKALRKSAYQKRPGYQDRPVLSDFKPFPTIGMIFAFDSITPETLGSQLATWCEDHEPSERPDAIWLLNKGYLAWVSPDGEALRPSAQGTNLHLIDPLPAGDIIYPLAIYLNAAFGPAWMPPFDLFDYTSGNLGESHKCWIPEEDGEGTPSPEG
ncbi:DUF6602 domain-containing protein [Streptomyces sp. NPDC047981]|uniref:DUF6602 domain-containing protein n=1 Tax=Streptomyces sp. NPDC047981 TaxID=3154610 RepID=UPI0034364619